MEDWWENWFSDLNMKGDNSFTQCQTNSYANINGEHKRPQPTLFQSSLNIEGKASQGKKRSRSCWEARDHIMSERKRRQDMAEKFIALSALIPGLKKIDKASILGEAINYMKQLKERIAVLEMEEESKRQSATSMSIISIGKSQSHHHPIDYLESNKVVPEVEAISIETEKELLLIRIHCEKRKDILFKLLVLLENMHLTIASSSVLPFGKNTLNITIIAQMGEEYSVTEEVLVKILREDLLKLYDMQCQLDHINYPDLPLMEHSSWDNWPLNAEVGDDEKDLAKQCNTIIDDEEFLRNILQQPSTVSFESDESQSLVQKSGSNSLSSNEMEGSVRSGKRVRPRRYILSFDKSTIIPATQEPLPPPEVATPSSKSKKRNLESKQLGSNQGEKKTRSDSQIVDHIMAERKRRQQLSQKFIALSATIPGLKKMDKTSILREAISYVKILQERVRELEKRNKRGKKSTVILNKKTDLCGNEDTTSSETNSEDCCELLPVVKAKMLENEVLIEIHCEKENGIELKIFDLLENLHLFVTGSSVLPFGNSTFGITIIAQMAESYRMAVNDLVETLRRMLMNRTIRNTHPY